MRTRVLIVSATMAVLGFVFACTIRDVTEVQVGSVQIEPSSVTLLEGQIQTFTAQGKDGLGKDLPSGAVTWTSDAPSVFSIDTDGNGEGMTAGQTTVWATLEGTRGSATVVVEPGPRIVVDETPLVFYGTIGGDPPEPVLLDITNGGGGSLGGITASVDYPEGGTAGWLSIALAGTSAPTTLHLSVLIGILGVGTHEADLLLTSPDARNSPVTIPVQMVITLDRPVIGLNPRTVGFQAVERGAPPPPQTVQVTNQGGGVLVDLEASPLYFGVGDWLSASLAGTSAPTELVIQSDPTGLPPGTYHAEVRVTAPQALNTPQAVDVTLTVDEAPGADLEVTKAGPEGASAGSEITYALSAQNLGPGNAEGVTLTDTLPPGVTFLSATGGGQYDGGAGLNGVVQWNLGDLTVEDGPQTVRVNVAIGAGITGSLLNVAGIEGLWLDPDLSNNHSTLTTTLGASTDLAVGKTAPATGAPGGQITYTVVLRNNGPSNASGVVLTDTLPTGVIFVSASGGGGYSASSGPNGVVTWSLGTVPASAGVTSFQVVVQVGVSTDGAVVNTAAVRSSTPESDPANNRATAATTVTGSDVTVAKTGPPTASPGGQITYTVTFQNTGPSDATGVVVTDTLPTGVTFVSATGGGTHSGGVVTWAIGTLTVAAGAQTRTVTVDVGAGTSGSIQNVAAVTTTSTDPDPADNRATATTDVQNSDLSVTKTGPATAAPGANISYTLTVQNNGPSPATGIVATDTLPATATFVSATGGATPSGGVLTWNLANLAAAGSQVYTVTVSTASGASGSVRNAAAVTADQYDGDAGNNHSEVFTTLEASADLALAKTGPESALPEDQISYTLTVENLGPSDAAGVVVTDHLPAGVTFISATGGGVYDAVTYTVTWNMADLVAGATQSVNLVVTVGSETEGAVINTAELTATTPDPDSNNNQDSALTSVSGADLSVSKIGPTSGQPGQTATYSITVENLGPSVATDVVLTDQLPEGVTLVSATPADSLETPTSVIWPAIPTLASGATANYSVQVTLDQSGTQTNSATVASSSSDFNADNDTGSAETEVNQPPTASFSSAGTGLTIDFTDTSTDSDGTITAWSWDFGDGGSSTAQNPSHTYATSGDYSVTLTVTDDDGATDDVTETVSANQPPTAGFTFTVNGLTVDFTDTSTDSDGAIASWSWDFGDGGSSSAQNPSHTYATGGDYSVTLTVTDNDGATDDVTQTVSVNQAPTASFTSAGTGLTIDFTDTSTDSDGTITAWSWDFGDGGSSTAQNPSHTFATGGDYSVTLTVTDNDGATDDVTQTVSVNQPPTAGFTFTENGLTVDFTDTSTDSDGTIASWSWDFGDGGSSTAQNPSHTYATGGDYSVTLTVTDNDGATNYVTQTVSVNQAPTASFTSVGNDLTVDFTDTSTDSDGTITAWSWDFGDGGSSTAQNPSHTYAASGDYSVTLTVTDNDGATDDVTQTVSVNQLPTAGFTFTVNGLTVDFTDTSTDPDGTISSWSWDFGDGGSSSTQNPSHTYAGGGDYSVTLTVTDNDGGTDDITQTASVNEAPTAAFTFIVTNGDVTFTDTSTDSDGTIVSWSWNFGDGGSSTAQNPSHTYAAGGDYSVTLTVTDDDGATDDVTQTVTITAANLILTKDVVESGPFTVGDNFTYRITVENEGPETTNPGDVTDDLPSEVDWVSGGSYDVGSHTVTWSIGGQLAPGAPQTLDIVVQANQEGTFQNSATIAVGNRFDPNLLDNTGSVSTTVGAANQAPTASFTSAGTGLTIDFTDTSTDSDGTITAWSWDFGDGGSSTAQNPSHTYATSGDYSVTLTVTDDDGATDDVTETVSANQPPTAGFTFTENGLTVDFIDTSTDSDGTITAWSWDFGDGGSSTAQNPSHTYATGGDYSVTLTVTDNDGATDDVTQTVSVNQAPTAAFTSAGTGLTIDFTDTSTDSDGTITAWSWDFGDGGSSTAQNPSHTYAASGDYSVTLTVTDDDGATDDVTQTVSVNQAPTASFTSAGTGLTIDFTDTSTDSDGTITAWSWDFGDGGSSTAQNPSHTYATGGDYSVTLTVTDDDGATDDVTQTVSVNQPPAADFTWTATNLDVSFSDQSTDSDGTIVSWDWDFGDTGTSTVQDPAHSYAAAGDYSVTLTVTDNDGATGNVTKTVSVTAGTSTEEHVALTESKTRSYSGLTSGSGAQTS